MLVYAVSHVVKNIHMKIRTFWITCGVLLLIVFSFYFNGLLSSLHVRDDGFFLLKEGTQDMVDGSTVGSANYWKATDQSGKERLSASLSLPEAKDFTRVFGGETLQIGGRQYLVKKIYLHGIYPRKGRVELVRIDE